MKLPFKSKPVEVKYLTITEDNYELEIPIRPFSYKDVSWLKENQEELSDESKQDEANYKIAEYYLRSRFDVSEEVSRDELFRYDDGSPFSIVFIAKVAEAFGNEIVEYSKRMEELGKSESKSKQNSKRSTRGVQKDG